MTRPTQAIIDQQALAHNFKQVRGYAPHAKVMAVVKANAYGHGLVKVAKSLKEADAFAVACSEEASSLRYAGITQPIVLLEGVFSADEWNKAAILHFIPVIHHPWQLAALEQATLDYPVEVWLKIDTGMHRLGFPLEDFYEVYHKIKALPMVELLGIMTHFAAADEIGSPQAQAQLQDFAHVTNNLSLDCSMANSAGILAWPASHHQWVRPGLMLYGVSPLAEQEATTLGLKPVMTLTTRLIAIKQQKKGDPIGYNATWRCPEEMSIGIAAIGYGDGYPRALPSGTPVLIEEHTVSLIGRVSMDMIALDLRNHSEASIGDTVTLWGKGLPVEIIAEASGTIPYELLCRVMPRVAVSYQ